MVLQKSTLNQHFTEGNALQTYYKHTKKQIPKRVLPKDSNAECRAQGSVEFSHDIHTAIVELIPSFINLTQPRHHRQRAVLTQRQSINYCNWLF